MLIRPAKNERVRFVALSVFSDENTGFQHVLIRPAKHDRVPDFAFPAFTVEAQVSTR